MAVPNELNNVRYTGDGTTVAFTITFSFEDTSHIRLLVDDVVTTSGFTVTGGTPNGTLTFDTAPANEADIFIRRVVPITQGKSYPTNDTFPSESHEAALDRLTHIAQQQKRDIELTLKFPESFNVISAVLPTPEDDKTLSWDGTTGAIKNGISAATLAAAEATATAAASTATTQAATATTQAGIATTQAELAESWAIDPIGDRAEGSAKYWAEQAAEIIGFDLTADNVFTGDNTFQGLLDINNVNAETASGFALRNNNGTPCVTIGAGSGNNFRAEVNLNMNSLKITGLADPTSAQDGATKAYVDAEIAGVNAGGWVPLATTTVSSPVASVDFTSGIDGTYKRYALVFDNLVPVNDNVILLFRIGNGGAFDSGASDYGFSLITLVANVTVTQNVSTGSARIELLNSCGSDTGESQSGIIYINNPADSANRTTFEIHVGGLDDAARSFTAVGNGVRNEAAAHDRVQLLYGTGDVESGTVTLYGLRSA